MKMRLKKGFSFLSIIIATTVLAQDASIQQNMDTAFNRGLEQFSKQQYDEAALSFEQALTIDPTCAPAYLNLSLIHLNKKHYNQALITIERAIAYDPNYFKAYVLQGNLFEKQNQLDNALSSYKTALTIKQDDPTVHVGMGTILRRQGKPEEALEHYNIAVTQKPSDIQINFELGNLYYSKNNFTKAIDHYKVILQQDADLPEVECNLAHALRHQGCHQDAIGYYEHVVKTRSTNAHAHYGLGESYLMLGNYLDGWREFEWRLHRTPGDPRKLLENMWDGSDPAGKTILLRAEFGRGDAIQFIRYAELLKAQGATTIAEVHTSLVPLLSRCPYLDSVIPIADTTEQLPHFDAQIPLMSLPNIYKTTIDTVPAQMPYLHADPTLVEHWREKLAGDKNFKIGVCWQVSAYYDSFKAPLSKRSIPVDLFEKLAAIDGVSVYSLQKSDMKEALRIPSSIHNFGSDFDETHGNFMDSAAIMENLDLIITVDTSVAHLAGALGKQVWVLLPSVPDWRWLQQRTDSPWYPTMRLFRQARPHDWASSIENVVQELSALCAKKKGNATSISAEIAYGELFDRITILEIKMERIKDPKKLANIKTELDSLTETQQRTVVMTPELEVLKAKLLEANKTLWDVEDAIRIKEFNQEFDDQFIKLARSVYVDNDERCKFKRAINDLLGSRLIEEKSYQEYRRK